MGLGESRVGRRLSVGAEAPGVGGPAISPARLADRRALPAVRKSPYRAMRCGLRHAPAVPEAWVASAVRVGRAALAACAVSAALVGRVDPAAWAVLVGRAVPGEWAVSAVRVGRAVPGQ